ncbi:HD domain-containing protein [Butyricicoccus pullicaecorum]|nr:HD domain-containing protein [Butyricicoccus pullicaecorum]
MDIAKLAALAAAYDAGDPRRVHHFMKVYAFARLIGQAEGLDEQTQEILDAAALLHDIGIHTAERKFGACGGPLQEAEGPSAALPLLKQAGADEAACEQVCWLIAHHHSPGASDALPFRILLEADFLVNAYEDALPPEACRTARTRLFRTRTGTQYLDDLFLAPPYQP